MNNKLILIILLAIMLCSLKQDSDVNAKANQYMDYLNSNRIKGGCFYMKGDSIVTFKNF